MTILKSMPKKKLKIILCGVGVLVAMSLLATAPPLSRDSAVKPAGSGKAAALKAPAGQAADQTAEAGYGSVKLTTAPNGSSPTAGGYSLQGTAPAAGTPSPAPQTGGSGASSSPVSSQPVTEPDVLYPVDPAPKCAYYYKPGTMMPYSCPICETYQTPDGGYYPCGGCYGGKLGIMCANPD